MTQLHGKELSFNNLLDLSSARELVEEFDAPACAIVKHNNPCGCALGETIQAAYERAFACDPQSAYGGVIALNRPVDRACAERLSKQFIEVLLAPGFDPDALELLQAKKNVRLLELGDWPAPAREVDSKPVIGGQLVQTRDVVSETREQMRAMTATQPSEAEWEDMLFAWRVCRHVRSNAIVIASGRATIGIGAGQTSRVDAVRIAVEKAHATQPDLLAGSALASDAFFPFADGPQLAIDAGVGAIIQPGGSVRDEDVIAAVDAAEWRWSRPGYATSGTERLAMLGSVDDPASHAPSNSTNGVYAPGPAVSVEGLVKRYGEARSGAGHRLRRGRRRDVRVPRPQRRGQVDDDQHALHAREAERRERARGGA